MPSSPQRPSSFHILHDDQDGRSTTVWWRWRQLYPGIYFFAAVWAAFALFAVVDSFSEGATRAGPLAALLLMGIGYGVAAGLLNRTYLEVDASRLSIRHEPLPWPGGRTFRAAEVSGVLVESRTFQDKNGASRSSYSLHAVIRGKRRVRLLSGLPEVEQARFLEQRIVEGVLGIQS
ncbi:hypothetical protein [Archangium lipolyticum]|uniref:hypothetical protein n=1 Tax=Archangium lipolyticum TaxID=2970465 RepID=UPI002149B113|nr:hypothetical protein [Archangium lipolyticum]